MLLDVDVSQLVLVDFQDRLLQAMFEPTFVIANAVRLVKVAAILKVPVFATEQNPSKLGSTDVDLSKLLLLANVRTLSKMHFSAVEEGLSEWLRPAQKPPRGNARSLPKQLQRPQQEAVGRETIVLAGCEAHICLLQTALDLIEDDFDIWVVTDACTSRTEQNRDAAFDRLASAGAELVTTEMVVFEWLRSAEHPAFKEIQTCIIK